MHRLFKAQNRNVIYYFKYGYYVKGHWRIEGGPRVPCPPPPKID